MANARAFDHIIAVSAGLLITAPPPKLSPIRTTKAYIKHHKALSQVDSQNDGTIAAEMITNIMVLYSLYNGIGHLKWASN